jgi:hypothetical protein
VKNKRRCALVLTLAATWSVSAFSQSASDQLDLQDRQEFNVRIIRAEACVRSSDLDCAARELNTAKQYANLHSDKAIVRKQMEALELRRQLIMRDDIKRQYGSERQKVERQAELAENETADMRREARRSAERDAETAKRERRNAAAPADAGRASFGDYLARDLTTLAAQNKAQAEAIAAASRGSSVSRENKQSLDITLYATNDEADYREKQAERDAEAKRRMTEQKTQKPASSPSDEKRFPTCKLAKGCTATK